MKITKTFASVFLSTFLIGYVLVLPTRKTIVPNQPEKIIWQVQDFSNSNKDVFSNSNKIVFDVSEPKPEPKFEPKIFDLPDYSEADEIPKYKMKLMDIVETGNNFDKEEIEEAKSSEIWLGLFEKNDGFYLRDTKIKIRPEHRKNYGRRDSLTIKLDRKGKPVFLLKNAGKLRKGKVKTLYRRPSYDEAERLGIELKPMKIGFAQKFKLGKRIYNLEVKAGLTKSNEKRSVLILKTGNKSQILYFNLYFEAGDNIGSLLWVGDLDRDGKLDLYLDFYTFEKGGFDSGLFLSSEAEKGDLVKQVADFGTLGC